ncbi:MAG: hypothetical protein ACOYU1_11315 [Bacteroidota bacterium]
MLILFGLLFATSTFAENALLKQITKITVQSADYTYNYTLSYDFQNRVIKIVPDNSEIFGITHIEYATNTFRIGKGDMYVSGSLNEQGYIDIAEDGDFPVLLIGNMFYNEKGLLSSIENGNEKMLFTWKNDDMVQMNFQDEQIDVTYTTFENKNQFGLFLKIDEDNCTPVFPYYTLLGKATQHLPASVGQGEQKISYQYKIDKDGFVTEIAMIYPDNGKTVFYRFAYD